MKLALVLSCIRDFFGTHFVLNIQRMRWGFNKKGRLMGVLPYLMFYGAFYFIIWFWEPVFVCLVGGLLLDPYVLVRITGAFYFLIWFWEPMYYFWVSLTAFLLIQILRWIRVWYLSSPVEFIFLVTWGIFLFFSEYFISWFITFRNVSMVYFLACILVEGASVSGTISRVISLLITSVASNVCKYLF